MTGVATPPQPSQAALREEQSIYPDSGWEYANTSTRDTSVLPGPGSWSATPLVWPNLHWMRRSLSVPTDWQASRRVLIHVGSHAHYVKVYFNDSFVGEHYGPVAPYVVDVTPHVNWSGPNVLMLGVQDWTCLLAPGAVDINNNGIPGDASYVPAGSVQGPLPLAIWIYLAEGTGKLWTQDVRMQGLPKVRVTDVFVRPSVRQWKLDVDLTIRNDDASDHTVSIDNQVTKWNDPAVVKSFATSNLTVPAGASATTTVSVAWTDPILWRPSEPQLYSLATSLSEGGAALDALSTRFGFREFWIEKSADNTRSWFVLNGARQNLRGESVWHARLGNAWVSTYLDWLKSNNFNCVRMCNAGTESYYDLADEKGILVESEVPYYFNHNYGYGSIFWARTQAFALDQVRMLRNHPSIVIWSVANEVTLTAPGQALGADIFAVEQAVQAADPTRTVTAEGDGDLRTVVDGVDSPSYDVPVVNIHNYDIAQPWRGALNVMDFPNAAYVFGETTDIAAMPSYHWGTRMVDKSRPWYIGEFGPGCDTNSPHVSAFLCGDAGYQDLFGQATGLMQAMGLKMGFQIEGMRYFDHFCGIAPWSTYYGDPSIADGPVLRTFFKPVTARIKEWTHNFFAGDTVSRTITVYNDDAARDGDFNLHWRLASGGQDLLSGDWNFVLRPGFFHRDTLAFTAPATADRMEADLILELREGGTLVDTTTQALSIFPARADLVVPAGLPVYVYDPMAPGYSRVSSALTEAGVGHTVLGSPDPTGRAAGLYIMGHGAYPAGGWSAGVIAAIQAFVRGGGTILVYSDQYTAPHWLSIYGDPSYGIQTFWVDSTMAFLRAPHHPVLAGLRPDDCKWWAANSADFAHYLTLTDIPAGRVNGNWPKPAAGAFTVLVDNGGRNLGLGDTPLCEYPDGKGGTILCTLRIIDRLGQEPAARMLMRNILDYAASCMGRPAPRGLGVLNGAGSQTTAVLDRTRFAYQSLSGQLAGHSAQTLGDNFSVLLIDNDAAVWDEVDANRGTLQGFVAGGGKVILRQVNSARAGQASLLTGAALSAKPTQLRHPQLEKRTLDPAIDGLSHDDVFWVYQSDWRTQTWASAIVSDVISVAESASVRGLLVEPNRTGVLQPDSGQSYGVGDASRDPGVEVADPGFGLVRIDAPSGTGYYLVDQVLWDAAMDMALLKKANRYLATILTRAMSPWQPVVIPTPTPTAMPTSVPTATPTQTPSATPPPVDTPTPPASPTPTATASVAATDTPAPTSTPTRTPAPTVTLTATKTPTRAATATATAPPTATISPTSTPTASSSPTMQASATWAPTPTITSEATASGTTTVVPTATPTPLQATATLTPTATRTPTVPPTATGTASPSPQPPTQTPTSTWTVGATTTAVASPSPTPLAAATATRTTTVAASSTAETSATPPNTPTLRPTVTPTRTPQALETSPAAADWDGDGVADAVDNCPDIANADQQDSDADGVGDACDAQPAPQGGCGVCSAAPAVVLLGIVVASGRRQRRLRDRRGRHRDSIVHRRR